MIDFVIDKICNCLIDTKTGQEVPTSVIKVSNKRVLAKYNSKSGWYVNWSKFSANIDIYMLLTTNDKELQGLIAIENDKAAKATHIAWAVTAPHNNTNKYHSKKYLGVGGHLFAIAAKQSFAAGYGGLIYGEASCQTILDYYVEHFRAERFPFGHPYKFVLNGDEAKKMMEAYTYDED